jgi:hypothetical protein
MLFKCIVEYSTVDRSDYLPPFFILFEGITSQQSQHLEPSCSGFGQSAWFSAVVSSQKFFACSNTIRARSFLSNRSLWFRKWTGSLGNIPFTKSTWFTHSSKAIISASLIHSFLEWLFSASIRLLAAAIFCLCSSLNLSPVFRPRPMIVHLLCNRENSI